MVKKLLNHSLDGRNASEMMLFSAFSLVAAVALTGLSIFTLQKGRIFANSAVATQAEVIEIVKEPVLASDSKASDSKPASLNIIPIFQYKVEGTVFEQKLSGPIHGGKGSLSESAGSDSQYSVGDMATIYYNPENPSEIRDILGSDASSWPSIYGALAMAAWLSMGVFVLLSIRALRRKSRVREKRMGEFNNANGRGIPNFDLSGAVRTACIFVALEATPERIQNSHPIRLVCRWIHPESGEQHLLRSQSFHPTKLPPGLELGMMIPCLVDFDEPQAHEVLWREFSTAGLAPGLGLSQTSEKKSDPLIPVNSTPSTSAA